MGDISLHTVSGGADLIDVRRLCWEYRAFLHCLSPEHQKITETFYPEDKYGQLMANLLPHHAPPFGVILVAKMDGQSIGCGMIQPMQDGACEIKRVFVDARARRKGAARLICQELIAHARAAGAGRLFLDTSKEFQAARALYLGLGFHERGPYSRIPADIAPLLCYFELNLSAA